MTCLTISGIFLGINGRVGSPVYSAIVTGRVGTVVTSVTVN